MQDVKRCLKIFLITTTKNNSIAHAKGKKMTTKNGRMDRRKSGGTFSFLRDVTILFSMSCQIMLAFT